MPTVFFDTNLGGDGSTYNDASFANGGHRVNFLPSLNNVLGVANFTLGRANAAATSATNSANSATAANTAKLAAELALDQFTDQYLGPKSSAPTLDNDGNALLTGAIYFDTTKQALQVYTGTIWIDAAGAQASFKKFVFTATASQTVFSVSPDQYTPNFIQVYLDGVLLDDVDYTATNGTTLTLAEGANAGQKLTILRLDSLDIANVVRAIQATDLTPESSLVFDDLGNATFTKNLSTQGNTNIGNGTTDLLAISGNTNVGLGLDVLSGSLNVNLNRTQGTANLAVHQPSTGSSVVRLSNTTSGFGSNDGLEIFTDGSNAGIWNKENGSFSIRTNNLERFSISNLGESTFSGNLAYTGTLTGGSVNNTPVGNTTPSSGAFTTLSASGATTLNGAVTLGDAAADAIAVTGTATFAQAAQFPDGTAALPAITNTGDTNTGVFFPGEDIVGFANGGVEAARITAARYFKASNTGTYGTGLNALVHEFSSNVNNIVLASNSSSIGSAVECFSSTLPSGATGFHHLSRTAGTTVYQVLANGDVQNTNNSYGAISDVKVKENIVDSRSLLNDFMQVRFVNYNMKAETGHNTNKQFGVIAQELEQVFPGLVDSTPDIDDEGNDLGTVTKSVKYSVLAQMQGKVIQEQQAIINAQQAQIDSILARVETLEAKLA